MNRHGIPVGPLRNYSRHASGVVVHRGQHGIKRLLIPAVRAGFPFRHW